MVWSNQQESAIEWLPEWNEMKWMNSNDLNLDFLCVQMLQLHHNTTQIVSANGYRMKDVCYRCVPNEVA